GGAGGGVVSCASAAGGGAVVAAPNINAGRLLSSPRRGCSRCGQLMSRPVNPRGGNTTDWRAGCGKPARPVRREGKRFTALSLPLCAPESALGRRGESPLQV